MIYIGTSRPEIATSVIIAVHGARCTVHSHLPVLLAVAVLAFTGSRLTRLVDVRRSSALSHRAALPVEAPALTGSGAVQRPAFFRPWTYGSPARAGEHVELIKHEPSVISPATAPQARMTTSDLAIRPGLAKAVAVGLLYRTLGESHAFWQRQGSAARPWPVRRRWHPALDDRDQGPRHGEFDHRSPPRRRRCRLPDGSGSRLRAASRQRRRGSAATGVGPVRLSGPRDRAGGRHVQHHHRPQGER